MKRTPKPLKTAAALSTPEPASTPGTDPQPDVQANPQADAQADLQPGLQPESATAQQATPTAEQQTATAAQREERIRNAAYERYAQRNGEPGDATADWLAAEAELDRTDPHPAVWAP